MQVYMVSRSMWIGHGGRGWTNNVFKILQGRATVLSVERENKDHHFFLSKCPGQKIDGHSPCSALDKMLVVIVGSV